MDTEERLIPKIHKGSAFFYEHLLRYLFAAQFVKKKYVLDLGCGSGYGSNLLSKYGGAKEVLGVDIAKQAIDYANKFYKEKNITFDVIDIENLNGFFNKWDVALAFEVLEHLEKQEDFLKGVKNNLSKGGIFIVSTPNTNTYPKGNPFHKKELKPKEFETLLKRNFKIVKIFHQGFEFAQTIKGEGRDFNFEEDFKEYESNTFSPKPDVKHSQYLLAICSNDPLPKFGLTTLTSSMVNSFDLTKGLISLAQQFNKSEEKITVSADEIQNLHRHLNFVEEELKQIKSSNFFQLANKYYGIKGKTLWFWKLVEVFWNHILKPQNFIKAVETFFTKGPKGLLDRIYKSTLYHNMEERVLKGYQRWLRKNTLSSKELRGQKILSRKFKFRPKISILTPAFNTPDKFLKDCIESVLNQTYDNFELCLVDDASSDQKVRDIILSFVKKDSRIKYLFRRENGHISKASNSAFDIASGEYIGILDHDDILWPNALFEVVKLLNENKDALLIYSDEDKLGEDGTTHIDPFFKPDFSPDYLRSCNYITHFCVIEKKLVEKIGKFRANTEGAQDWDLFLRATKEIVKRGQTKKILHIPKVLYSWRKSNVSAASHIAAVSVKAYAYKNQRKVLEDDISSDKIPASLLATPFLGCWRVKYPILGNPLVSIIIPTKDKYEYITRCLNSLIDKSTYKNYEIILVDTGSLDKRIWKFYKDVKKKHKRVSIFSRDKEFNFAAVCNFGAKRAKGEYLIFLNNDTEVIASDWIEALLEHAQRDQIGAVGGKLLYPNGTIQHAGIITGVGGVANHMMRGFEDNIPQGFPMLLAKDLTRNVSAITGACLCIKKSKFFKIDGFNEEFKIAYNDVDLCLRLYYLEGLFNLYTPYAVLYHFENTSIGNPFQGTRNYAEFMKENDLMKRIWQEKLDEDPFYNKNLTKDFEDCSIG